MGPNGSGKSTLAAVLTGREEFAVTGGEVRLPRPRPARDASPRSAPAKACSCRFSTRSRSRGSRRRIFSSPPSTPCASTAARTSCDAIDFLTAAKEKAKIVGMDESFLNRSLNEGFSGGEKKRNEIFQMLMLEPTLAVLDETDSGLDVDALRTVADGRERASRRQPLDARHHALPASARTTSCRTAPTCSPAAESCARAVPSSRSKSKRRATRGLPSMLREVAKGDERHWPKARGG